MYDVPKEVSGFSGQLNYVSTCPNQPENGLAFFDEHSEVAKSKDIPASLKEYTEYKKKHHATGLFL